MKFDGDRTKILADGRLMVTCDGGIIAPPHDRNRLKLLFNKSKRLRAGVCGSCGRRFVSYVKQT